MGRAKKTIKNVELNCTFSEECNESNSSHWPADKSNVNGNNIGSGPALSKQIFKIKYSGKGYKKNYHHPLSVKNGPPAQAHHLICSEAMDDDDWFEICCVFGYDVNCWENGVFLPSSLELACELKIPLHRGNHYATETEILGDNYVDAVEGKIDPIKEDALNGKYCEDRDELISQMNKISNEIWREVISFNWTLTFGGILFAPTSPFGCKGTSSIKSLRKVHDIDDCSCDRDHPEKESPKGAFFIEKPPSRKR